MIKWKLRINMVVNKIDIYEASYVTRILLNYKDLDEMQKHRLAIISFKMHEYLL